MPTLSIDSRLIEYSEAKTILEIADSAGIYIPRLCHHPDLPAAGEVTLSEFIFQGNTKIEGEKPDIKLGDQAHCNLCIVEIEGQSEPLRSCATLVENGMVIRTDTSKLLDLRRQSLGKILATHPHACLTCAQKEGCSRIDCSSNVPVDERCCVLLGNCELEKICDYIGIPADTPKFVPKNYPIIKGDPLFNRDYNLCIGCLRCVRVCRDVREADVLGAVWKDDRIWIGALKEGDLREADCLFCGACVEVCPTGALLDKENVPAVRREKSLPCTEKCPAGIDIPRYLKLIAQGRDLEALNLIRSRVPFPGILGYVCFHPCEANCRRKYIDQAVPICALKRFVADKIPVEDIPLPQKKADTGKSVAIIGAGPAGLTAAYYLSLAGHRVDLYDEADQLGGMLRYAIPDYRIPPEVVDRELEQLNNLGISFHQGQKIDNKFGISKLKEKGFNAILIAAGTSKSKVLNIENSELENIFTGLEFLKSAKINRAPRLDGRTIVIGGGNVAIDAAMTAVRLGSNSVKMVCLEKRDEMPAHEWEIAQAEEENIEILASWGPLRFLGHNGHLSDIELRRCTRVFDPQGKFSPQYDENEIITIPADYAIITIGQEVDKDLLNHLEDLCKDRKNLLKASKNFELGIEGVYAVGDVLRGPSSVVEAIADGRLVAEVMDKYLGGNGLLEFTPEMAGLDDSRLNSTSASIRQPRQSGKVADPRTRISGFEIIENTYDENTARQQAQRCLQCHLRQLITPVKFPPERWLVLANDVVEAVPDVEGVFQLLDDEKKILRISGAARLKQSLLECLDNPGNAKYFVWEEDPMYTKRESELIQQYLQKHGELPAGGIGDDLDDLF